VKVILHHTYRAQRHAEAVTRFRQDGEKRSIITGFVKDRLLPIAAVQQVVRVTIDQISSSSWHDLLDDRSAKLHAVLLVHVVRNVAGRAL
jgi:hypothetical protein